jgi:hypothetical protein
MTARSCPFAALVALSGLVLPGAAGCRVATTAFVACGDGLCESDEGCADCPDDCGACAPCDDGSCDAATEDCTSCPEDCGRCDVCGDSACVPPESCASCAADCGPCDPCGDGACSAGENCALCAADCRPCNPVCGNGACDLGEECADCPSECACGPSGLHEEFMGTNDLAGTIIVFTPAAGGYLESWACAADFPVAPGSSPDVDVYALTGDEDATVWTLLPAIDWFGSGWTYFQAKASVNGRLTWRGSDNVPIIDSVSVFVHYLTPGMSPLLTDMADAELTVDHFAGVQFAVTWNGTDVVGNALSFQVVIAADATVTFAYPPALPAGGPAIVGLSAGSSMGQWSGNAVDLVTGSCP